MAVSTTAIPPTAVVTEIPGRWAPGYVVDRRNVGTIVSSTTTNSVNAFLPRTESYNATFSTPTTSVNEIGANYNVGDFDDLPESKLSITAHDVSYQVISLITGKAAPASATTTYGFNDLSTAQVDIIRQFADPNGNIFASMYMGDMVIEGFGLSLKQKSAAMEDYSFVGPNMLLFRGFFVTKAIVASSTDVTNGYLAVTAVLGADEQPVTLPVAGGGTPASYWTQRGSLNFVKVERYRAGLGWKRFPETAGTVTTGLCKYNTGTKQLSFAAGDIVAGDVFYLTYGTYKCNVANYTTIPQTTLDTSDPIAISTRLTPFTISGSNVARGQSLDIKMTLKRERAEGIGDTDAIYGPPDAPQVSISLDVKKTDMGLNSLMTTGSPLGTDNGGTVAGDYIDPNRMTRVQLATAVPIVCTLNDPRNAGAVMKTYTCPTAVFTQFDNTGSTKNAVTEKYTGKDYVGNITVSVTRP